MDRLGVGADPNQAVGVTNTPGLSEANRRLGSALRKQARQLIQDDDDSDGSASEIESRARAVGKRENAVQWAGGKRKDSTGTDEHRKNCTKQMENEEKGEKSNDGSSSDEEWGDDVLRKMTEQQNSELKAWANGFASADKNGAQAGGVGVRKKRKKIRSRQKNLRRDKRKRHELPSHLTEKTLRAGRVRKRADGGWTFEASAGSERRG